MDAAFYLQLVDIIVGILGILGNGIVCVVIGKVSAMQTLTNAFIFNQAVIDFLASLFMILQRFLKIPPPLDSNGVIAALQCQVWHQGLIMWILFVASTFSLVLLTVERYVAIVYPFKYLAYFGRRQATVMLITLWGLSITYKLHKFFFRAVIDGVCGYPALSDKLYLARGIITFLVEYLIPLIIMTFCYIHIILQLKKASSNVHAAPATDQRNENSMSASLHRAQRNTLKTLAVVFVAYTVCWSPNQIAFFMFNFGLKLDFQGPFYIIAEGLTRFNFCVNPIIYAFRYKQFQRGVRTLLKPCCPKLAARRDDETLSTITARAGPSTNQQD